MKEYNCSVRIHSRRHLELKTEYPLITDTKKTRYQMDFYFFFPSQLNVTGKRTGIKRLLANIRIYTRFSTPGFSLKMQMDRKNKLSPLYRIRKILETSDTKLNSTKDIILYELQVATNMFRAEVDKTVALIAGEIEKHSGGDGACTVKLNMLLDEMESYLSEFRGLHSIFINPRITDVQRKALDWADESLSIITERALNWLFTPSGLLESPDELLQRYEELARRETDYRKDMNYQYYYREEDPYSGEVMAYRESVLKKWSQSAMYMTNEDSRTPHRMGHIIAGIAAGIAMAFAVAVTIFADTVFARNSVSWVMLIVISYIFKDRIKEVLRDRMKKMMPGITPDQLNLLFTPSQEKKVGVSRGYVSFGKAGEAPDDILMDRYRQPNPFRSILPEPDLLHYRRTIELNSVKLRENHTRLSSITEIIRINIDDWLKEMDDPKDIFYRLEEGKKIKIKGNRVYKINLLVKLQEGIHHYCLFLNKVGILRIEDRTSSL